MAQRKFELLKRSFTSTGDIKKAATPGAAAKKFAKDGHKEIFIREVGKDSVRQYKGSVKKFKQPIVVERGGITITYTKEVKAEYVGVVK